MQRFTSAVAAYVALCLLAIAIIVIRGDGPHPRVIGLYPPNGDRYFPGGLVEITFSQPMDTGSVESALQVSPGSQGQGAWFGSTLNLQPLGDWRPNITYQVRLTGKVTDSEGRPLPTPVSFWFHVHHLGQLTRCPVHGILTVCEHAGHRLRPLFYAPRPVEAFAPSPDGSLIAYVRTDTSGLPHLFVISADGTQNRQLTRGRTYADSTPYWTISDNSSVNYDRRRATWRHNRRSLGPARLWNVGTDGSLNSPL
jgi:Bacterial Ig-like domain